MIEEIHKINPNVKTVFVDLDLSDLDSVRKAAKFVLESLEAEGGIDGLINNAGVMCTMPFTKTKQGIELQFGTVSIHYLRENYTESALCSDLSLMLKVQNHIGHFLWTNLLLPKVLAAAPGARIVTVASTGYVLSDVALDDINWSVSLLPNSAARNLVTDAH